MPLPPLYPSLAAIAVSLAGVVALRRLGPALPRPGPAPVARGVAMDRFLLGLAGFALAQWGRGLLLRFLPAGSSPGVGYAAVGAGQLALAIGLASVAWYVVWGHYNEYTTERVAVRRELKVRGVAFDDKDRPLLSSR